jgi:hypothetical protein
MEVHLGTRSPEKDIKFVDVTVEKKSF